MAEVYFYKLSLQTAAFRNRIASKCPICNNWCHLAHGVIKTSSHCVSVVQERGILEKIASESSQFSVGMIIRRRVRSPRKHIVLTQKSFCRSLAHANLHNLWIPSRGKWWRCGRGRRWRVGQNGPNWWQGALGSTLWSGDSFSCESKTKSGGN